MKNINTIKEWLIVKKQLKSYKIGIKVLYMRAKVGEITNNKFSIEVTFLDGTKEWFSIKTYNDWLEPIQ